MYDTQTLDAFKISHTYTHRARKGEKESRDKIIHRRSSRDNSKIIISGKGCQNNYE